MQVTIDLCAHVEALHDCNAVLEMETWLEEKFDGSTVWEGSVSVFSVDHPDTDTCYAWSYPIEGSDKRKFYAVLKIPPVETAADAVRAAIVNDYRK